MEFRYRSASSSLDRYFSALCYFCCFSSFDGCYSVFTLIGYIVFTIRGAPKGRARGAAPTPLGPEKHATRAANVAHVATSLTNDSTELHKTARAFDPRDSTDKRHSTDPNDSTDRHKTAGARAFDPRG